MFRTYSIPVWKIAPFIRLLLPFSMGIIVQWYLQFSSLPIIIFLVCFLLSYGLFKQLPLAHRFKGKTIQGLIIQLIFACLGLLITWQKDIRHDMNWFGNNYHDSDYLVINIIEPLTEKSNFFKAEGTVASIIHNGSVINCKGKLFLYFSKDATTLQLKYGDRILINRNLQPIKNSGNPGAFNYQQYAAFQQIFYTVYLKDKDWVLLEGISVNHFKQFLFYAREKILSVVRKNVNSGEAELGIAEALLIGYTNDLDKDLVQAYSNTGVVHIIAISGMHLALIYVLLVSLFTKVPFVNKSKFLQVILILSSLWLFSLLTGGAASVLRSAVMFSFISIGKNFIRPTSIYNALAASALVLLCYNPYFLWDVGFQLSYLALASIIIFQKPIYDLIYCKNKWVDKIWQLAAVSIAAQLLTLPICIYYFHQFPVLFLFVNIIVVPLSTVILYVEIILLVFSWIPFVGSVLGRITGKLVWLMNAIILRVNDLPFAVWDNIPATIFSSFILYAVVISCCTWLIHKGKKWLRLSLRFLLAFFMLKAYDKWLIQNQQKLIVYNITKHQAIDLVWGNTFLFIGDSSLMKAGPLSNSNIKLSRIVMQLNERVEQLPGGFQHYFFYQAGNKTMAIIDKSLIFDKPTQKIDIDLIIISRSPKLQILQLAEVFNCKLYVFDASNSLWKIGKWQKECEALHLPCYSIPAQGAFVSDL